MFNLFSASIVHWKRAPYRLKTSAELSAQGQSTQLTNLFPRFIIGSMKARFRPILYSFPDESNTGRCIGLERGAGVKLNLLSKGCVNRKRIALQKTVFAKK